jgi:hypothetical protein
VLFGAEPHPLAPNPACGEGELEFFSSCPLPKIGFPLVPSPKSDSLLSSPQNRIPSCPLAEIGFPLIPFPKSDSLLSSPQNRIPSCPLAEIGFPLVPSPKSGRARVGFSNPSDKKIPFLRLPTRLIMPGLERRHLIFIMHIW